MKPLEATAWVLIGTIEALSQQFGLRLLLAAMATMVTAWLARLGLAYANARVSSGEERALRSADPSRLLFPISENFRHHFAQYAPLV